MLTFSRHIAHRESRESNFTLVSLIVTPFQTQDEFLEYHRLHLRSRVAADCHFVTNVLVMLYLNAMHPYLLGASDRFYECEMSHVTRSSPGVRHPRHFPEQDQLMILTVDGLEVCVIAILLSSYGKHIRRDLRSRGALIQLVNIPRERRLLIRM